jgi:PIN domain nuclease of toxin-antitoxin system
MGEAMMLLLDTCALLWLASDQQQLSRRVLGMIDRAPIIYISGITCFEIGIKYQSGKLKLPLSPREWCAGVLKHHDVSVLPLDAEICIKATELPSIHRDPCDRFIIATALIHDLRIITADERFREYGVSIIH